MHDVVDLEEIAALKEAERRHYREQSRQAAAQAMEGAVNWGADPAAWEREYIRLSEAVGKKSPGGNAVEDVRRERR